jgi:hypothetical protein
MGTPLAMPGGLLTPNLQGVPIQEDPVEGFPFFQLQGGGQGGRADQIVLAVLFAPLNYLQFGLVSHGGNTSYIASYVKP